MNRCCADAWQSGVFSHKHAIEGGRLRTRQAFVFYGISSGSESEVHVGSFRIVDNKIVSVGASQKLRCHPQPYCGNQA